MVTKILLLFSFLILSSNIVAQSLELFAGVGVNGFFDKNYDDGHYRSEYRIGLAKSLGFGLFRKTGLGYEMGLTVKYMEIDGGIDIEGGGLGAGFGLDVNTTIRTLEFGLFPLNLKLLKDKFELRLGMEFAYLIRGEMQGEQTGWYIDYDYSTFPPRTVIVNESKPIDSTSDDYFTDLSAFVCFKMGYTFPIGQKLELVPRLHFGFGLGKRFTDEVDSTPKNRVNMLELVARRSF